MNTIFNQNKFKEFKNEINANKFFLDVSCSYRYKILDSLFIIFEKYDASDIAITKLLQIIRNHISIEVANEVVFNTINVLKHLFDVGKMQIFALDTLNNQRMKFYFFTRSESFDVGHQIKTMRDMFDVEYGECDVIDYYANFLCVGITVDFSKPNLIENFKVYGKPSAVAKGEPYIKMLSIKNRLERYEYYLCEEPHSIYKFIKKSYGINIFTDFPCITDGYRLSEIQIAENYQKNNKINLYFFDDLNENC